MASDPVSLQVPQVSAQAIRATRIRISGDPHRKHPASENYRQPLSNNASRKTETDKLVNPSLVKKSKRPRGFIGLVAT